MNPFKTIGTLLLLLALVMLPLSGCGGSDSDSAGSGSGSGGGVEKKYTLAVIGKTTVNDYWEAVESGAMVAGEELGAKILWTGPDAETNHTQQSEIVDNMVNRSVDGIVLAPTNFTALVRAVESAVKRGIPVIIIDSPLDTDTTTSTVATNNREGGRVAGEALAAAIGENATYGGKVAMLRFLEGSASTEQREEGFEKAAGSAGLKLVDDPYTKGQGGTTDAADTADALLRRHIKNNVLELDGIFASNQPTAVGMVRKLDEFRKQGFTINAKVVGFDSHTVLNQAVRDGKLVGIVVQDPQNMGRLGVKTMIDHLEDRAVEAFVDTGVTLVNKDNIEDPDIKTLIGE